MFYFLCVVFCSLIIKYTFKSFVTDELLLLLLLLLQHGHLHFNDIHNGVQHLRLLQTQRINLVHLLLNVLHLPLEVVLGLLQIHFRIVSGSHIHNQIVNLLDDARHVHTAGQRHQDLLVLPAGIDRLDRILGAGELGLGHFQGLQGFLENGKFLCAKKKQQLGVREPQSLPSSHAFCVVFQQTCSNSVFSCWSC